MSLSFPASPTANQVYQGWKWNGSAWDPNYAANFVTSINGLTGALGPSAVPGVGNRVLLQTQIISAAQQLINMFYNFTNLYDQYEVEVYNLRADTNGTQFAFRCSTDGSTFDSGSNYSYGTVYANSTPGGGSGGGAAQIFLATGALLYLANFEQSECQIRFSMPWAADRYKYFYMDGVWAATTGTSITAQAGAYGVNAALKGLQFFVTPGNITRGVFNLYGIVKSGAGGS